MNNHLRCSWLIHRARISPMLDHMDCSTTGVICRVSITSYWTPRVWTRMASIEESASDTFHSPIDKSYRGVASPVELPKVDHVSDIINRRRCRGYEYERCQL